MITDQDITKLKTTFATKDDLQNLSDRLIEAIQDIFGVRSEESGDVESLQKQVDNHETRILKLETHKQKPN